MLSISNRALINKLGYNMNLLEQLAFYSCKFDSLFPELSHYLPNQTKNTKTNIINYQTPQNISENSEKSQSTDLSLTTSISILEQQQAKVTNPIQDVGWIEKCSRLSWIGSMIEKKVLKLKYEFFIYLSNSKENKSFLQSKQSKKQSSCHFSPKQLNSSYDEQVQKEQKMQFVVSEVNEVKMMSFSRIPSQNQLRRYNKQAKNIRIKQLKALPHIPKQQSPLIYNNSFQTQIFSFGNVPQISAQIKQVENPDLNDFVDIFIKDEIGKIENKTELNPSPSHLSHLSQSDLQKQLRNSHIKRFQELELTAFPINFQSKRRLAHTTLVSGLLSQSIWMGCNQQEQKLSSQRKSSLKLDMLQEIKGKDSILVINGRQLSQLQSSQYLKSLIYRKSYCEGQYKQKSTMLINESKINQQHNKEREMYIQFKRTIERRRESTLKQIESSQKLLTKLMRSFKSSKKPQQSKKYTNQKNKEKTYSSIKKITNTKSKSASKNRIAMKGNPSDISPHAIKEIFTERPCDLYQQQTSLKTIQQKQKMEQKRRSPHKTDQCSNASKKQTKNNMVDTLLQSCKNVSKKQPRIKLKVELGLKSVKQKQQLKAKIKKNTQEISGKKNRKN